MRVVGGRSVEGARCEVLDVPLRPTASAQNLLGLLGLAEIVHQGITGRVFIGRQRELPVRLEIADAKGLPLLTFTLRDVKPGVDVGSQLRESALANMEVVHHQVYDRARAEDLILQGPTLHLMCR